ncbi:MAG TPA: M28 family metallopeptidase [Candidatus Cloacimonadota bacterium]|nr:M28 family metallopeptidase [Candidatus Cloacimonadota bacterium]HPS38488.1 M28 family metallopeptidase [Candidatus Cloacimonadota bacterium]
MNLYQLLKSLDFERLAGTEGEKKGIGVISQHLRTLGLEPGLESFELNGFESGTAIVTVGERKWEATPYGLCGDCVIEGEMVFLENADALMLNPGMYKDKIVLFYHSDRRIYELYENSGVKAFIGISSPLKKAYSFSHRQNRDKKEIFPIVMISYDFAEKLMKHDGRMIKLEIRQKTEKKTAHNIVVDIKGKGNESSLTLLVGHYDTVARSHGACDNGGGSVCLLKAAEYFSKHKPERDLRIIWFSGEELGLLGSFAYAKAHEEEIQARLKLVINVDLAGDPIGRNVMFVLGTKELMGYAGGLLKENGMLFSETLNIYSSDCMPFSTYEVPSLNLARVGGSGLFYCHTEDDKARNASPYGLQDVYEATVTLLDHILNSRYYPVARGIDDSLREKIEKYLWHSLLEKPELKWVEKYRK